jgi:hypothetical protein
MEERTRWDGIARSIIHIMEENREVNTCEEASSIQLMATHHRQWQSAFAGQEGEEASFQMLPARFDECLDMTGLGSCHGDRGFPEAGLLHLLDWLSFISSS